MTTPETFRTNDRYVKALNFLKNSQNNTVCVSIDNAAVFIPLDEVKLLNGQSLADTLKSVNELFVSLSEGIDNIKTELTRQADVIKTNTEHICEIKAELKAELKKLWDFNED